MHGYAVDIIGDVYRLELLYGVYFLQTLDGKAIDFDPDVEVLVRKNLGYHAQIKIEKRSGNLAVVND
jgi:hypothetical protein